MNLDAGQKTIAEVKNANRFFKSLLVVFALSNLVLTVSLLYLLMRDNVIITPPVVTNKYEIGANTSEKYLVDMAEYVITMLRTVNKDNVDYNNNIIFKMVDADHLPQLRKNLDAQASRIKREDIMTVWSGSIGEPQVINRNTVVLSGKLKTYYSDKLVSADIKDYRIEFGTSGIGRIYVKKVEEVKPDDAAIGGANP